MSARSYVIVIVIALAGCGSRNAGPTALPVGVPVGAKPSDPAKPAPEAWIRFMPQSTYFCVRLPDGQVRSAAYGVGGNTYSLQEGIELAHAERDALCTNYGITVLGARGQFGTTAEYHSNYGYYNVAVVEPKARSLAFVNNSRCYITDAGEIVCGAQTPIYDQLLNGVGPIDHAVKGAPCMVYRDGQVACVTENGQPALVPMFTNAKDAAIVSMGWSKYVGCALLRDGTVSCLGTSALTLRGFTTPDDRTPTVIPNLDHVDEITASWATACARRGGEVWCWGESARGQAGAAAKAASVPMPKCVIDQQATDAARAAFDKAQAKCQGPRPGGDDPFCRAMWQAIPPGTIFQKSNGPCDPSQDQSSSRWAKPRRVEGITDAIAIGTNGGLTCAIDSKGTLTCFGNGISQPKSITFPARKIAAEQVPPAGTIVVPPRGLAIDVGDADVVVSSVNGAHSKHAFGAKLGTAVAMDKNVIDTSVGGRCKLLEGGHVECVAAPNRGPLDYPDEPEAQKISAAGGQGCVLLRDGLLRCSTKSESYLRPTAALAAMGTIVEHAGWCARYSDGGVRCVPQGKYETVQRAKNATSLSIGTDGRTGCWAAATGEVQCTGDNRFKQRGDNGPEGDAVTTVPGMPPIAQVAASGYHACALAKDGSVWCWGRATHGELGPDAARAASEAPKSEKVWPDEKPTKFLVAPAKVIDDAIAIGVAEGRSCALTKRGELTCWGAGSAALRSVQTKID